MKPAKEETIRRFLLGEMEAEERFEFEELFVADGELFEQINVIEGELIEKYVRGWMTPAERVAFETQFLTTDRRRERIEFSRELINQIDSAVESGNSARDATFSANGETLFGYLRRWFLIPQIAAFSAIVLVAIVGGWFLLRNVGTGNNEVVKHNNSNVAETPNTTVSPETIESPSETPEQEDINNNSVPNDPKPAEPSNQKSSANENIKKTPKPTQSPEIERSAPSPIIALFSGTVRSEGKTNELILPKNSKGATFLLNLPSVDHKSYKAELVNAEGNSLAKIENLKPTKKVLRLFFAASSLNKGDFLIKLYGKNANGESESVADFQFRVK